jgi:hypothetical protein
MALVAGAFALLPMSAHAKFLSADPVGFQEGGPDYFNRYVYAGNNPVNNIDPDGREIVPVGDSAYVEQVNTMLDTIGAADPELSRRIEVLRTSDKRHKISLPSGGDMRAQNITNIEFDDDLNMSAPSGENGERAPTSTLFDPNFDEGASPEAVLTHELLGHAYEKDQGIHNRDYEGESTVRSSEERAVQTENIYRGAVGEPLRESYYDD